MIRPFFDISLDEWVSKICLASENCEALPKLWTNADEKTLNVKIQSSD